MSSQKSNKDLQIESLKGKAGRFLDTAKTVAQMPKAFAKAMMGKDDFTQSLVDRRKKLGKGTSGSW